MKSYDFPNINLKVKSSDAINKRKGTNYGVYIKDFSDLLDLDNRKEGIGIFGLDAGKLFESNSGKRISYEVKEMQNNVYRVSCLSNRLIEEVCIMKPALENVPSKKVMVEMRIKNIGCLLMKLVFFDNNYMSVSVMIDNKRGEDIVKRNKEYFVLSFIFLKLIVIDTG